MADKIINFMFLIILVALIYFPIVILLSFIRALVARGKGKEYAQEKFKDIFITFFLEFLNPLNWFALL